MTDNKIKVVREWSVSDCVEFPEEIVAYWKNDENHLDVKRCATTVIRNATKQLPGWEEFRL